jgi:predicted nucleic acid-binding protein
MIVVADTSPLIVLSKIGELRILPALFGKVLIPSEVRAELAGAPAAMPASDLATHQPPWLFVQAPKKLQSLTTLGAGERAAISLALEVETDLLLVDDIAGRKAASAFQLRITGTIGILEMAADHQLIDLANAFERLKQTNFWVPQDYLDTRLRLFQQRQQGAGA